MKGATIAGLKTVHSHIHALPQCRQIIAELGLKPVVHADTAGAAADVAARQDPSEAAIASSLAGEIYGLRSLRADVADQARQHDALRRADREPHSPRRGPGPVITRFVFRVPACRRRSTRRRRLRHQQRQHHQARELYHRRLLHRRSVLCRYRRPSRRSCRCAWRWRSWDSSPARCGSSASTPPRRSATLPPLKNSRPGIPARRNF